MQETLLAVGDISIENGRGTDRADKWTGRETDREREAEEQSEMADRPRAKTRPRLHPSLKMLLATGTGYFKYEVGSGGVFLGSGPVRLLRPTLRMCVKRIGQTLGAAFLSASLPFSLSLAVAWQKDNKL